MNETRQAGVRGRLRQAAEQKNLPQLWRRLSLYLQNVWYLIRDNWRLLLPFLLLYCVCNLGLTIITLDVLLWCNMLLTGNTYLGPDNILTFFRSPSTNLLTLLLLIVVCFLHVVEISGIMHAYSMSSIGKKTTLRGIINTGIDAGLRVFLPKNWLMLPMLLVLIPLTGFFSLSFVSLQVVIPGFVREFIQANTLYRNLYRGVYFLLLLIEITYIFSMNFHLLGEDSFPQACRKSQKLIRGRYGFTAAALVAVAVLFSLFVTAASSTVSTVLLKLLSRFSSTVSAADSARLSAWILNLNGALAALLAPAVNIAALTTLFFQYIEDDDKLASLSRGAFHDRMLPKKHIAALCAVLAVTLGLYLYQGGRGQEIAAAGTPRMPEIVAHRGDSVNAPDNTMPAFEMAALEHPAWVELDVQQTKDGVILVSHDDDLQRVSGTRQYIHELTYDEIRQIDVGSWFSKEYGYVRLSTLDSVLKLFKDSGTRVMVEIKYTGFGDHVEESVLDIINENGMHDQTLIISTHPGTLERIKELDPSMITCYTMFVAWEHIEDIPFADWYTVEEGNIDPGLVENVHAAGGRVYAWTVNSQETVQYLIDCGVDGMLTDNPVLMKRVIENAKYDTGLLRALRIFLNELREF